MTVIELRTRMGVCYRCLNWSGKGWGTMNCKEREHCPPQKDFCLRFKNNPDRIIGEELCKHCSFWDEKGWGLHHCDKFYAPSCPPKDGKCEFFAEKDNLCEDCRHYNGQQYLCAKHISPFERDIVACNLFKSVEGNKELCKKCGNWNNSWRPLGCSEGVTPFPPTQDYCPFQKRKDSEMRCKKCMFDNACSHWSKKNSKHCRGFTRKKEEKISNCNTCSNFGSYMCKNKTTACLRYLKSYGFPETCHTCKNWDGKSWGWAHCNKNTLCPPTFKSCSYYENKHKIKCDTCYFGEAPFGGSRCRKGIPEESCTRYHEVKGKKELCTSCEHWDQKGWGWIHCKVKSSPCPPLVPCNEYKDKHENNCNICYYGEALFGGKRCRRHLDPDICNSFKRIEGHKETCFQCSHWDASGWGFIHCKNGVDPCPPLSAYCPYSTKKAKDERFTNITKSHEVCLKCLHWDGKGWGAKHCDQPGVYTCPPIGDSCESFEGYKNLPMTTTPAVDQSKDIEEEDPNIPETLRLWKARKKNRWKSYSVSYRNGTAYWE